MAAIGGRSRRSNAIHLIAIGATLFALLALLMIAGDPGQGGEVHATTGLDFSIGSTLADGAAGMCDSSGTPTATCDVPLGGKFKVSFYLNTLPAPLDSSGFAGNDAQIEYTGISSNEMVQSINQTYWPGCALMGPSFAPQQVHLVCGTDSGSNAAPYTGRMATVEFTCAASGSVTLRHGLGLTDLADGNDAFYTEAEGTSESLSINCQPPLAYPGDTDGDGCPDTKETGLNPMTGGRRNFLNPWDYFNPTGDGINRVDDILAVNMHYGKNAGDPGYDTKYDRTYLGPNPWNLGPPNGKIRIDDILNIIHQFGQDCH